MKYLNDIKELEDKKKYIMKEEQKVKAENKKKEKDYKIYVSKVLEIKSQIDDLERERQ